MYKLLVSPFFGTACRFEPSCSDYFLKAVELHGFFRGTFLGLKRIFRCNPLCAGGIDRVPER